VVKKGIFNNDYELASSAVVLSGRGYVFDMASMYAQSEWLTYLLYVSEHAVPR
jgi:hypothetical protein